MEFQCCAKQSMWCQGHHNEYDRRVSSSYGVCNTLERNTIKSIHEKFANYNRGSWDLGAGPWRSLV